jgi:hypothetical protein
MSYGGEHVGGRRARGANAEPRRLRLKDCRKLLKESGLPLIPAEGLMEAAEKAVAAASGKKGK